MVVCCVTVSVFFWMFITFHKKFTLTKIMVLIIVSNVFSHSKSASLAPGSITAGNV